MERRAEAAQLAAAVAAALRLELAIERPGAERAAGHALPVDRVEAAERVAEDGEPLGHARETLVATPAIRREAVQGDRRGRLGVADRVVENRRVEAPRELEERLVGAARMVAEPADQRHHPAVAFDRKQHAEAGARRRRVDHETAPVGVVTRGVLVAAARVADVDAQLGLLGSRPTGAREPLRHARSPPARVDDEVGGEGLLLAAVAAPAHPDAGDVTALVDHHVAGVAVVEDADAVERGDAPAHVPVEKRPALAEHLAAARKARLPVAEVEPARVGRHVDARRPAAHELVADAGKVRGEDALALLEEHVHVTRLRNAFPRRARHGFAVALDDGHRLEVIRQHAGGEQAREAAADDDGTSAAEAARRAAPTVLRHGVTNAEPGPPSAIARWWRRRRAFA